VSDVLVRWKTRGSLILAGRAYRRAAGEEDEMPEAEARALAATGVLKVVDAGVPTVVEVVGREEDGG